MTAQTGRRLRALSDLGDTHLGRQVTVRGLTGRLDGLVPVGDRITLTLCIGSARVFTDAFPADEPVEVWKVAT